MTNLNNWKSAEWLSMATKREYMLGWGVEEENFVCSVVHCGFTRGFSTGIATNILSATYCCFVKRVFIQDIACHIINEELGCHRNHKNRLGVRCGSLHKHLLSGRCYSGSWKRRVPTHFCSRPLYDLPPSGTSCHRLPYISTQSSAQDTLTCWKSVSIKLKP